jgi:hypothetical protein
MADPLADMHVYGMFHDSALQFTQFSVAVAVYHAHAVPTLQTGGDLVAGSSIRGVPLQIVAAGSTI